MKRGSHNKQMFVVTTSFLMACQERSVLIFYLLIHSVAEIALEAYLLRF